MESRGGADRRPQTPWRLKKFRIVPAPVRFSFFLFLRALSFVHGLAQEVFDLPVDTAQFGGGPLFQFLPKIGRNAQEKRLALFFVSWPFTGYSVPVLMTGDTSASPQRTTSRLLTMEALRSSSSFTTSFSANSRNAMSTMLTAPCTIFWRAAITASACCRRSITWAISGA